MADIYLFACVLAIVFLLCKNPQWQRIGLGITAGLLMSAAAWILIVVVGLSYLSQPVLTTCVLIASGLAISGFLVRRAYKRRSSK